MTAVLASLAALTMFFSEAVPMEMPRAGAYFVSEGAKMRMEDRFARLDLWISRTIDGRWVDMDGRVFLYATLREIPPETGGDVTRAEYVDGVKAVPHKDERAVREAIGMISPVAIPEEGARPRQLPRGLKDVRYWQGTNSMTIVCAMLPEVERGADGKVDNRLPRTWRVVVWNLIDGDEYAAALKLFEEDFLTQGARIIADMTSKTSQPPNLPTSPVRERELLRADARHAVAAYDEWRVTDGDEFSVLDDLGVTGEFVTALTNDLKVMRTRYAETMPTGIDGSNVLAVARIFVSRDEYLEALEADGLTNLTWTAAYWSPRRRELVAYLPVGGEEKLLETIRHEAFHQYISYASSMISVSPWLNEGYAQYFENDAETTLADLGFDRMGEDGLKRLAKAIPALFAMDYDAFYDGTDAGRRLKYNLAKSVAVFLEKGASKVRFDPFKDVKKNYFKELFKSKDMMKASLAAFGNRENLELFTVEWLKYWKER